MKRSLIPTDMITMKLELMNLLLYAVRSVQSHF